jgi:hypothetical protein
MTYDRAYADAFHVGVGMLLGVLPWMLLGDSLLPFLFGVLTIPMVLVIIPWTMTAIHKEVLN